MLRLTKGLMGLFIFGVVVWSLACRPAYGQATGRIVGLVKDSSGGTVIGANVTLTNEGTNISKTTQTDSEGNYLLSLVEPGSYRATSEHTGCKKYVQSGITLELNQHGRVSAVHQMGQVSVAVEVIAARPQDDTP